MEFKKLECSEEALINLAKMHSVTPIKPPLTKLRRSKLKVLTEGLSTLYKDLNSTLSEIVDLSDSEKPINVTKLKSVGVGVSDSINLVIELINKLK